MDFDFLIAFFHTFQIMARMGQEFCHLERIHRYELSVQFQRRLIKASVERVTIGKRQRNEVSTAHNGKNAFHHYGNSFVNLNKFERHRQNGGGSIPNATNCRIHQRMHTRKRMG